MNRAAWLLPMFLLAPLAALPMGNAETTSTSTVLEWTQFLFGKGNQTAAQFSNTTFTVTAPHAWTHVSGQSYVEMIGHYRGQGSAASTTAWNPVLHWDKQATKLNSCKVTDWSTATGDANVKQVPIHVICPVVDNSVNPVWAGDGETHGIHMSAAITSIVGLQWSAQFFLHQVEKVTFTQPGSTAQLSRMEATGNRTNANLNSAWATLNATKAQAGRLEGQLSATQSTLNATKAAIARVEGQLSAAQATVNGTSARTNRIESKLQTLMATANSTLTQATNAASSAASARGLALTLLGAVNYTRAQVDYMFPVLNLTRTAAETARDLAGQARTAAQSAASAANESVTVARAIYAERVRHRGVWSSATAYKVGDVVSDANDDVWMAIANNTDQTPHVVTPGDPLVDVVGGLKLENATADLVERDAAYSKWGNGIDRTNEHQFWTNTTDFRTSAAFTVFVAFNYSSDNTQGLEVFSFGAGHNYLYLAAQGSGNLRLFHQDTEFGGVLANDYCGTLSPGHHAFTVTYDGAGKWVVALNGSVICTGSNEYLSGTYASDGGLHLAVREGFDGGYQKDARYYEVRMWDSKLSGATAMSLSNRTSATGANNTLLGNETHAWFLEQETPYWGLLHGHADANVSVDLSPVLSRLDRIEPKTNQTRDAAGRLEGNLARANGGLNVTDGHVLGVYNVANLTYALLGRVGNNVAGARATVNHTGANLDAYRLQFNATDFNGTGNATGGFWTNLTAWHELRITRNNTDTLLGELPTMLSLSQNLVLPTMTADASTALVLLFLVMIYAMRKSFLFVAGAALVGVIGTFIAPFPVTFVAALLLLLLAMWIQFIAGGWRLDDPKPRKD